MVGAIYSNHSSRATTEDTRGVLTTDEIQYIEGVCHQEMIFFGYQPTHDLVTDVESLESSLRPAKRPDVKKTPENALRVNQARAAVIARIRGLSADDPNATILEYTQESWGIKKWNAKHMQSSYFETD